MRAIGPRYAHAACPNVHMGAQACLQESGPVAASDLFLSGHIYAGQFPLLPGQNFGGM
jgi:hypothetical protein